MRVKVLLNVAILNAVIILGLALNAQAQLKIVIMDCGQANAAFIQSPSGKACVIDAGSESSSDTTLLSFVHDTTNYGKTKLTRLDYVFVSHYHADHIYAMDELINGLGRDSILGGCWDRGGTYTTTAYTNYVTAAGSKRYTDTLGKVFDLGAGVTLRCVCMNGKVWNGGTITTSDENTSSMGLLLTYGNFKMIFATDIGGQATGSYSNVESLLAPVIGRVNVLLVNHHGSASSSNYQWVTTLNPQASIISCGNRNAYDHPTQTAIDTLLMDPKDSKATDGDSNYIYQTETNSDVQAGDIPAGRGRCVDKNIWIRVFPTYYVVVGDIPQDTVMFNSLAVELAYFNAISRQGSAELSWRTESETGCRNWEIHRSARASFGYVPIGEVPGHGTTNLPHDYTYVDDGVLPDGIYWYRLCEVNLDGTRSYYGPVSMDLTSNRRFTFGLGRIRPNPCRQTATVSYQLPQSGPACLKIYNILGQEIATLFDKHHEAGSFAAKWEGKDNRGRPVPNGVYYCRLVSGGSASCNKIIVVR